MNRKVVVNPLLMRKNNYNSAADRVVAHTATWLVSDHPGRYRGHPSLQRRGLIRMEET